MLSVVASRYARALVDVVMAPGSGVDPQQVLSQLRTVEQLIASSVDLRNALHSPAVTPSRKRAAVAKLVAPIGLGKAALNFLYVVIDHRRVHQFPSIVEAYETLLDQHLGFVRAAVTAAQPLDDAARRRLQEEISLVAGKHAKLDFSTDPALIAGVVARIGSTVYDGSVRGQLDRLRVKLRR